MADVRCVCLSSMGDVLTCDLARDPGSDPELFYLLKEYIPISRALTSDEYDNLPSG
jgi:hypothetical protein